MQQDFDECVSPLKYGSGNSIVTIEWYFHPDAHVNGESEVAV